jgi:hypothetical protein
LLRVEHFLDPVVVWVQVGAGDRPVLVPTISEVLFDEPPLILLRIRTFA